MCAIRIPIKRVDVDAPYRLSEDSPSLDGKDTIRLQPFRVRDFP